MILESLAYNEPCPAAAAAGVGMSGDEYEKAKALIGRVPNKLEVGIIGSMWSEHCSYKSSKYWLQKLPTKADHVLVGPGENAGIIDLGDGLALAFKVESHNHPSFIEPFQGAATGIGGILRDVFTMGARPIAAMNLLRFGAVDHPKTPHLSQGVISGISSYGNCFGVPTVISNVDFHASYNSNILVNAFALGLVKKDEIFLGEAKGVGNAIFYVGAKTGADGINGATMASDSFDSQVASKKPTVQVGDPFLEKTLLEACLEAFGAKVVVGIQDMGAAGLTSSSFEMAGRSGTGVIIDLDLVPLRAPNMTPYEIMLSESQERMLLVADPQDEAELVRIYNKWGLDCVRVGEVTGDGLVRLQWQGSEVCALPARALSEEAPMLRREYSESRRYGLPRPPSRPRPGSGGDPSDVFLIPPTQCDQTWNIEQYDRHIQSQTIASHKDAAAAVIRIKGTNKTVAMCMESDGRACLQDPRQGAIRTFIDCFLKIISVGCEPKAISDCLNYGSPEKPEGMWQLKEGILGLKEACEAFDVPVISGNVSLYNETDDQPCMPTPTVAMVGVGTDDIQVPPRAFQRAGDVVVVATFATGHLSFLQQSIQPIASEIRSLLKDNLIRSIHPIERNGIYPSLIHAANLGGLGVDVQWDGDAEELWRDQIGLIISCRPEDLEVLSSRISITSLATVTSTMLADIQSRFKHGFNEAIHGTK